MYGAARAGARQLGREDWKSLAARADQGRRGGWKGGSPRFVAALRANKGATHSVTRNRIWSGGCSCTITGTQASMQQPPPFFASFCDWSGGWWWDAAGWAWAASVFAWFICAAAGDGPVRALTISETLKAIIMP